MEKGTDDIRPGGRYNICNGTETDRLEHNLEAELSVILSLCF